MANEKFKINGVVSEVVPIVGDTGDVLKKTVSGVEWGSLDKATQAEAEAGTNDTKIMTPLRVKQVTEQYATKTELANIDLTEELENLATKTELDNKVDKVSGKQLSTNDYTNTEKDKLAGIQAGAQVNTVTSVNGQTGEVTTPDTKYTAGTNVSISGTTISATDTTYNIATTSSSGLMASADKVKLDKFTEVDNKPFYNGEEIGGAVPNLTLNELILGGRFKISYNDIEDSLDIEVI